MKRVTAAESYRRLVKILKKFITVDRWNVINLFGAPLIYHIEKCNNTVNSSSNSVFQLWICLLTIRSTSITYRKIIIEQTNATHRSREMVPCDIELTIVTIGLQQLTSIIFYSAQVIEKLLPAECVTVLNFPKPCNAHTPPVIVHESLLLINPTYDT
uniref:Uncharacterized protein n=1 Tax=Glossina pallidipes TaxID=7398 RepID=A0A1B0AJX8_GLOPL